VIRWLNHRVHRGEDGYALVVATILLFVMMILIVVGLDAGYSALNQTQRGIEWSRTLAVAESGVNDAIVQLGANRSAVSACPTGGSAVCSTDDGEYQVSWTGVSNGSITIESYGYFPTKATAEISRHIRVTMEPAPAFTNALFAEDTISIKNGETVVGDIYSQLGVTIDNTAKVCGSVVVANGGVSIGNSSVVEKADAALNCSGKDGSVWAGGSILNSGHIYGYAKASAPSGTMCSAASTDYEITGGTVDGDATACGLITGTVGGSRSAGTGSTPPAVQTLPEFVFDPANYPGVHCYDGGSGSCGATTSTTAVATANPAIAAAKTNLSGTYAVWQSAPSQSTVLDLSGTVVLGGDATIITNAPIYLGNANDPPFTLAAGVHSALLVIISLYQPTGLCDTNGGDCSIYGKNQVVFDNGGTPTDLSDGVAGLLYTTGKMTIKNSGAGEGALYAGSMDIKNGFDIVYNPRIARVLGFGSALVPTRWEELDPA
jgi:hypothetical protein